MKPGDITPFVLPLLTDLLGRGRLQDAVALAKELCIILRDNKQIIELWSFQSTCRTFFAAHMASVFATVTSAPSEVKFLEGTARLDDCVVLHSALLESGMLGDAGYAVKEPFATRLAAPGQAALCWRRYMRRRVLTFSRDDDKARADAFDARWALTLQARVRWLNAALRLNTVQAYVRMGIARRAWADLPVQRRAAARLLRACMRRRLLSEQLERFRAATYGLPLESVVNLRGIPRAQRAAIRKVLEPPAEGGEEEHTDLFAKFLQRQASHASGGSGAGARSRPATATATVPDQVRTLASRDAGSSERIVGVDVEPVEGMRVVLRNAALVEFPELLEDSGGGPGTITWVDPEDADGDGVTGDICAVIWDKTGRKGDYRTGFEGEYRLAQLDGTRVKEREAGEAAVDGRECVVGVDVPPVEGMRVVLRRATLREFPELLEDSGGGPGTITWVDPEDADGDGVTGDICAVIWERTGRKGDYRTGFEGEYRLAQFQGYRSLELELAELEDAEEVVGLDVEPVEGMRVVLRKVALAEFPELLEDSGGGPGTITWVDPEDADGDGQTGDICAVVWDKTGRKGDYRTGFEGEFRLARFAGRTMEGREEGDTEEVVGLDVEPVEGMRVAFRAAALRENPDLAQDSGGGPGTITWVDPEDADGDGQTGDICAVVWDKTGRKGDYRTGFEGEFRLARWFSPVHEAASAALQRVWRAHRARALLHRALVARFLVAREAERARGVSEAAHALQLAARCHLARAHARFERARRVAAGVLPDSGAGAGAAFHGAERLARLPVRMQAAVRGHAARRALRLALLALRAVEDSEALAARARVAAARGAAWRRFAVLCRQRVALWRRATRARRAHRAFARAIAARRAAGRLFEGMCCWLAHHVDCDRARRAAERLVGACHRWLWVRRSEANHFARFAAAVATACWLRETGGIVAARAGEALLRAPVAAWKADTRRVHAARKRGAVQRARALVRMCGAALREWHVAAWRRLVVRGAAARVPAAWEDFVLSRVLRCWRAQTHRGALVEAGGRVARLKLQAGFGPISKAAQSALARLSDRAVVARRRASLGPDAPPEEWRRRAWQDEAVAAELRARDAAKATGEVAARAADATALNQKLMDQLALNQKLMDQRALSGDKAAPAPGARALGARGSSASTPARGARSPRGSAAASAARDLGGTETAAARGEDREGRAARGAARAASGAGGARGKRGRAAPGFWAERTLALMGGDSRAEQLGALATDALAASLAPGPGGLPGPRGLSAVGAICPGAFVLPDIMLEARKPRAVRGQSRAGGRAGAPLRPAEFRAWRSAAKQAWLTGADAPPASPGGVALLERLLGPLASASAPGSPSSARAASPRGKARPITPLAPLAPLAAERRRQAAR